MNIPSDWLYPPSIKEATEIQRSIAKKIILEDNFKEIKTIAGMDVSNNLYDPKQMIYAGIMVLDAKTLQPLETSEATLKQKFPYVPGFLGFREAPVLVEAYMQLKIKPALIMVDGHGVSHPRGLGIASHIGVLLDCPTIGVAKSILVGTLADKLGEEPGSETALIYQAKQIATVLRSKARSKPLIISPGHRISLPSAVKLVKQCLTKYRLPEPTRYAHKTANECRKKFTQ